MTAGPEPYCDPFIEDVRARRRAVFAKYDNDLRTLIGAIQQRQAKQPELLVDRRKREPVRNPPRQ